MYLFKSTVSTCFLLYKSKSLRRLPVTMDSSCAKTPSNGLPDRTAHGLVSSNQRASRRDVIMAHQKPPVLTNYGAGLFKFTISHNSINTDSIIIALGLNDGKTCPLYISTSALFLHQGSTKSHSIPNLGTGCARYRAKSHTSVLKRLERAGSVNTARTCLNPTLAGKYIPSRTMA